MKDRIAVIGAGVAGLSTAWLLRERYDVTLVERNAYIGGHTHTVEVDSKAGSVPVDTGFIVYNEPNYPLLTRLFDWLGVDTQPTDMSFSASIDAGSIEYAGSSLQTLFARPGSLTDPRHLRMLREILDFNRRATRQLQQPSSLTLGGFLERHGYSRELRDHYLLPMAAAIWSCPVEAMLAYPMHSFGRFFANHGLLSLRNRPQWRTVSGGSYLYVKAMLRDLGQRAVRDCPVEQIRRGDDGRWSLHTADGELGNFDQVVLACHADEAWAMLSPGLRAARAPLAGFRYQENQAVLHSDSRLMPRLRRVWSAWNYRSEVDTSGSRAVCVTYWMNRLQRLDNPQPYFVTLNPLQEPAPETVHARMVYHHPVYDSEALRRQPQLQSLQGRDGLWLCGSYFGYGFHEDALRSAVEVADRLDVQPPWVTGLDRRGAA
ncbi:NAD/FAD-binding protein [Thiohalobacter sp. COW1]|uniref:NAD(P)/FAD-dependent oxidoreductase n=1 Tax=Thiohalobacter sp. COW1 TaxID=2795687 RepID=UPI0019166462|nr:FAD-dependent oxidoreductase [Thiohalobacter sp. COW1]BCO30821.1 NAD/FAD-binding protein [Thiohalobacter sp. COW1]